MSKSFSEIVEDCLSEFLKTPCVYNFPDRKIDIRKFAAEHHFLPILLDWSAFYALYPNGEMVVYDLDNFKVSNEEIEPRIRNTAMFDGVKKFPSLLPYLPQRLDDDIDCPYCEAVEETRQKLPENVRGNIGCYCGGLGWIPKE